MSAAVLTELVNSAAWFLVGLAAGYLVGRLRREVREIREVVVDDSGDPGTAGDRGGPGGPGGVGGTGGTGGGTGGVGGVGGAGGRVNSHWWGQRAIGVIVLAVAALTVVQGWWFARQEARIAACQASYTEEFTDALRVRARIAEEDRRNFNTLVTEVLGAQPGRSRDVLRSYLDRQAELDAARAAVPLPTLPEECQR